MTSESAADIPERCEHGVRWENKCFSCTPIEESAAAKELRNDELEHYCASLREAVAAAHPSIDDASREQLWHYVDTLVRLARRALKVPEGLHPETRSLVVRFAAALAAKLYDAEQKYGYDNGWAQAGWMDQCRAHLRQHIQKGDPRDVAAYCAFLWHHGESTAERTQPSSAVEQDSGEQLARRFHEIYERLAPQYGYETRTETRQFDPDSKNGRLMVATCGEVMKSLAPTPQVAAETESPDK